MFGRPLHYVLLLCPSSSPAHGHLCHATEVPPGPEPGVGVRLCGIPAEHSECGVRFTARIRGWYWDNVSDTFMCVYMYVCIFGIVCLFAITYNIIATNRQIAGYGMSLGDHRVD